MNFQTDLPCLACGENKLQRTFHHLKSRKAFPEFKNESWNLMPLCLTHHNQIHKNGLCFMVDVYENIRPWLVKNNWIFETYKWRHYDN